MSYEKQPDPVLPNYNPSAWDSPLSAEEQEVLDAYYVKFPTAQNAPITFPNNITINGTLNAGTISSTTDTVSIGTGKNINLGVAQLNNGYISIGSGTHGSSVGMNLGSESLGNVYFRSGSIELNTTATSGNIILGGSLNAGNITLNKPITIGYSIPTINTQLGYTSTTAITWLGTASAIIAVSPTLPIGIYMVNVCFELNGTYVPGFVYTYSGGASPIVNNSIPFVNGGDRVIVNGSFILNLAIAGTFNLTNFSLNTLTYASPVDKGLYITRIA